MYLTPSISNSIYPFSSNKYWKLFWLLLLCPILTSAQQFTFKQYTTDDGLPSSCVYAVIQDDKGFLWLATEGGLCKFDGHEFIKSPIPELNKKEIIHIDKYSKGRLWFTDLTSQIYVLEGDILIELKTDWYPNYSYIFQINEDRANNIWITSNIGNTITRVSKDSLLQPSAYNQYSNDKFNGQKAIYAHSPDSIYLFTNYGCFEIINNQIDSTAFPFEYSAIDVVPIPYSRKLLLTSNKRELTSFDLDSKEKSPFLEEYSAYLGSGINSSYLDDLNNIWICTRNGLLLIIPQKDGSFKVSHHLEGVTISNIYKDREDNYWITSTTDGLFLLPSIGMKSYLHPKWNKIAALLVDKKQNIIIGTDDSKMIVLDENFKFQFDQKLQPQFNKLYSIDIDQDSLVFSCSDNMLIVDNKWNIKSLRSDSFKQIKVGPDGRRWYGSAKGFGYVQDGKLNFLTSNRVFTVYPIASNRCYFGTLEGLYLYDNGEIKHISPNLIKNDIRNIYCAADSTLYLSTQGDGLILLKENQIIHHYTIANGLLSDKCTHTLVDEDIIWLATNKGLHKINTTTGAIHFLTKNNGLANDEVNHLYELGDILLAGTSHGLSYFDKNMSLEEKEPSLYLSSVKVVEKDTSILDSYQLSHNQNNIKISFSSIYFTNPSKVIYQYKLDGLDEKWINATSNEAQYPSLAPGNYSFYVKAKGINSEWSSPIQLEFLIHTPFWQKWWFRLLSFLLANLTLYLFISEVIEYNKRQTRTLLKIKESQLAALRSRMNPHFLFNSLNSIQEFIITNDKRVANRYLGQFSTLMRKILNMSEKERITLKEEIETLELYIGLEAMRFEDEFDYIIECIPSINPLQEQLPPMLIQPFVENAILHGLHQKEGQKQLVVAFDKAQNYLICTITDNGIGRVEAQRIKEKKEQSFPSKGMGLTEERINLLNSIYHRNLKIDITDLKDEHQNALGTKVVLRIAPLEEIT